MLSSLKMFLGHESTVLIDGLSHMECVKVDKIDEDACENERVSRATLSF
jgi:hypothetical protein